MPTLREVKNRIRSVKNIAQITRALEAVSASRVRRAQARVLASRIYAEKAWEILVNVQAASKNLPLHPVVHYVDSKTSEPTQVADLISAARRRTIEGTSGMRVLNTQLASLRAQGLTAKRTHTHRPWTNQVVVI